MPRILLVDDEELNRDFLSRRLEKRGYQVLIAVDGQDACAKALSELPDLVLMDCNMPVMDGLQATRQIKSSPETQRIPVIALTALAMAGDREKVIEAGCDDYESKPIDFQQLLVKIQALLERRAPT